MLLTAETRVTYLPQALHGVQDALVGVSPEVACRLSQAGENWLRITQFWPDTATGAREGRTLSGILRNDRQWETPTELVLIGNPEQEGGSREALSRQRGRGVCEVACDLKTSAHGAGSSEMYALGPLRP